jgi:hypothetical protein
VVQADNTHVQATHSTDSRGRMPCMLGPLGLAWLGLPLPLPLLEPVPP